MTRPGMLLALSLSVLLPFTGCKKSPSNQAAESASGSSSAANSASSASTLTPDGEAPASGSLAARLNAVQSGEADKNHLVLPNWKPFPANATRIQIPLRAGLGLTGVHPGDAKKHPGDLPNAAYIEDISATQLHVHHYNNPDEDKRRTMSQYQDTSGLANQPQAEVDHREPDCDITVDLKDLATSNNLRNYVCQGKKEYFPGTDPFGLSTDALTQLRAGKQVDFAFVPDSEATASFAGMAGLMGDQQLPPVTTRAHVPMFTCMLHRVEAFDFAFPVMLNDEPVELPVMHVSCSFPDGREAHMYVLDQLDNPMEVWHNMGILPETLQLVQIVLPPPTNAPAPTGSPMEAALAQKKPVEVYGIYFDFNKDVIKPQSAVVLKQIAGILQRNPDWKLSVSGHTDNIGDDKFNQDLSVRRANAVKNALVTQYKIDPTRLSTAGYGASRPIADNNTVEGRARNRRVELQRQ
jgi:outer membrane protein OmpA-like peptidoglycan-associated protein